jgi:mono/diheme cytochrome c family protein
MRASVWSQVRGGWSSAMRAAATLVLGVLPAWAVAADAARGAALYLQTDRGARSCVACHGPEPGLNRNNLLRAADQPLILTSVLSRVSAMAFLDAELTTADREDVAAFLGATARLAAPGAPVRLWPLTLDFGQLGDTAASAVQAVRVSNVSSAPVALGVPRTSDSRVDLGHDCPAQLAPASSCELLVRVRPGATGTVRSAVQLDTGAFTVPMVVGVLANVPSSPPSMLAWRGDGGASHLAIAQRPGQPGVGPAAGRGTSRAGRPAAAGIGAARGQRRWMHRRPAEPTRARPAALGARGVGCAGAGPPAPTQVMRSRVRCPGGAAAALRPPSPRPAKSWCACP